MVVSKAIEMNEIQRLHPVNKTLRQDDIAGQITACLRSLNDGTDRYQVSQVFGTLQTPF